MYLLDVLCRRQWHCSTSNQRLQTGGWSHTNKIMRVLIAFYQYKKEKEGKGPMPIEVFKERKRVINELSKV